MLLRIENLTTTVRVVNTRSEVAVHEPPHSGRPSMDFAMPLGNEHGEGGPSPSQTATVGKGPASKRKGVSPRNADPHLVSERVYELMVREVIQGIAREGAMKHARRR